MQTHEILRKRLLEKAGIFDKPLKSTLSLSEIYRIQWNNDFERYMRNRLAMGYFRYGRLDQQINRNLYDNISSIKERIALYEQTSNREFLVDIANIALVEFTINPNKPFISVDDGIHTQKI